MTGASRMEHLIEEIKLRQAQSREQVALQGLEEVLDILERLSRWLRQEPEGARKEKVRQLLTELGWLDPDTLLTASPEELRAGTVQLLYGVLE